MADEGLARPDATEKLRFEASALLTGCGTASEQDVEPKAWVPAIATLRRALHLAQPGTQVPRLQLGYQPGGGRGNVSLYWLELASEDSSVKDYESESEPSTTVLYRRSGNGAIRPSLAARLFLRNGEMRNLSVRGISFLSSILLGSALWLVLLSIMLLSLSQRGGPLTMGSLITLALTVLGFVFIWREVYAPWFRVIDDCVVKAPTGFLPSKRLAASWRCFGMKVIAGRAWFDFRQTAHLWQQHRAQARRTRSKAPSGGSLRRKPARPCL